MITSREYDQLCKVTDDLRTAIEVLHTAGVTGDIKEAARQFVVAEEAWEAFTIRLVEDTATTATDADGWTEWRGGVCPVDGETMVVVKFRDESMHKKPTPALTYRWTNEKCYGDIIAYRIVKP